MTKTSTRSKPSTESDTGIKNNPDTGRKKPAAETRFAFPLFRRREENDFGYNADSIHERWGSSSDKLSSLTVRILSVNIIAIVILGLGILYLGQYTESLIEGELTSMRAEARFFSGALSEGTVRPVFQISPIPFEDPMEIEAIKPSLARRMLMRLSESATSRVQLYSIDGTMLADTASLGVLRDSLNPWTEDSQNVENIEENKKKELHIGALFDQSATRFLSLIPIQTKLPTFPQDNMIAENIFAFPDAAKALAGDIQTNAWEMADGGIILTAAAPIQKVKQVLGVVILVRDGTALEKKIAEIRVDVFRVFLGSLGITVMLSIYLSGLIGRPLKRLAMAAEAVRQGKGAHITIPDLSARGDEIGELSLVLRDMTQALYDRMDTIERFAADVAHEIKNPLTSLRSAVETAARVKDDASRKKLMDIIHHDVRRLDRLISDISSASRLDAELLREELEPVDLLQLLNRLADAYKKPLERAGEKTDQDNQIVVSIEKNFRPTVIGNDNRLGQVFGNILSNALSFSPAGKSVQVIISEENQWITVKIQDEGSGIPPAKLETIFDRFYTERPDHEGYGNHSGLGLSISRQIIDAHGGQIYAENREGKGARFVVKLKAA